MKKLFFAVAAAAALLLPMSAHAAEKTGFYVAPKFILSIQYSSNDFSYDYSGSSGSYPIKTEDTQTHGGGALAVGYDFTPKFNLPIRAELEYGVYGTHSKSGIINSRSHERYKIETGIKTLLLNVYCNITEWNGFTPYIGAGIGMAFVKTEVDYHFTSYVLPCDNAFGSTERVLAGQFGLGCSYAINDTVAVDLGYRFLMTDGGKAHSAKTDSFSTYHHSANGKENYLHQFTLGLRVTF